MVFFHAVAEVLKPYHEVHGSHSGHRATKPNPKPWSASSALCSHRRAPRGQHHFGLRSNGRPAPHSHSPSAPGASCRRCRWRAHQPHSCGAGAGVFCCAAGALDTQRALAGAQVHVQSRGQGFAAQVVWCSPSWGVRRACRNAGFPDRLVSTFPPPDEHVRTLYDNLELSVVRHAEVRLRLSPVAPAAGARSRTGPGAEALHCGQVPYLGERTLDAKGQAGQYEWMTYGEAGEARTAIGSGLLHFGLAPGATVGLYSVNCRGMPAPLAWTGRLAAQHWQSAFETLRRLGAGGLGMLGLLDGVGAAVRHAGAGRGALHLRPR